MKGAFRNVVVLPALVIVSLAFWSTPGHAYTEAFYICQGGNGTQPKLLSCAAAGTCWDADDFSNGANWSSSNRIDGKIGPNDLVVLLDDCGPLTRATGGAVLEVHGSGFDSQPITIRGEPDGNAVIDGRNARECIESLNRSHLEIAYFECTAGEPFGILIWNGNHVTIDNCESHDSRRATLFFSGTNGLVSRSEFYGSKVEHGVYFGEDFTRDSIIEYSYIHDNDNSGIQYNTNGIGQTGMVCRYNWIENNGDQDINNLGMDGGLILGNIFVNETGQAYHAVWSGDDGPGQGALGTKIYNNTFYGIWADTVAFADGSTGNLFYNNIVYNLNNTSIFVEIRADSSAFLDNNQYYRTDFTNGWVLNGSKYHSLPSWQSGLGGCPDIGNDCNSGTSDPRFTDPSSYDFTLEAGSPCINMGAETIGLEFKDILDTVVSKSDFGPHGRVYLADQTEYGRRWEVGAYVYGEESPLPPRFLRIVSTK
jgi:hypothetical protein